MLGFQARRAFGPCCTFRCTKGQKRPLSNLAQPLLHGTEQMLQLVHSATGAPWYIAIPLTTIVLRGATLLPLRLHQNKVLQNARHFAVLRNGHLLRRALIQGQLRSKGSRQDEIQQKLRKDEIENMEPMVKALRVPRWPLIALPVSQAGLFVLVSMTLRGMSGLPVPQWLGNMSLEESFKGGGISPFLDLTLADSTGLFPIALIVLNLVNVEVCKQRCNTLIVKLSSRVSSRATNLSQAQLKRDLVIRLFRTLGIGMSVLIGYFANFAPMAITIYWLSSATVSLAEKIAFPMQSEHLKPVVTKNDLKLPDLP